MTVIPQIRINTPNSAIGTGISSEIKNNGHAKNPSFGFKPIDIADEGKVLKFIKWLDNDFNSAWQRLVSGVTALITQPFFDLNNKRVDQDTRKTSAARTIGKIIAGTVTGVTIREICIRATKYFTQNPNTEQHLIDIGKKTEAQKIINFSGLQQCLLSKAGKEADYFAIKKYRGAIGTYAAIIVMVATNFLIDAPLTNSLANYFNKQFNKNVKQPIEGGK